MPLRTSTASANSSATAPSASCRKSAPGATAWRGPIRVARYRSSALPASTARFIDLKKSDHAAMFEGSKGALIADFNSRILFPRGNQADLTYYKPRAKEALLPPLGDFQRQ